MIIQSIMQGTPVVVTILAIFLALVIGGILIAVSDPVVLHAWDSLGYAPGAALAATWHSVANAYSAMFEGAIFSPSTISAAFHGGSIAAIFFPLSLTVFAATPLILTGLAVGIAFRAGLFNIGATSQFIGGAIVATWLGFGVNLPVGIHVVVCVLGALAGGAVIGWLVGELKARTGAHEVIVTIMLNYVMEYLLSYLLSTPKALQAPHQYNQICPDHATERLPAARGRAAAAGQRGLPDRHRCRRGGGLAAVPQHRSASSSARSGPTRARPAAPA